MLFYLLNPSHPWMCGFRCELDPQFDHANVVINETMYTLRTILRVLATPPSERKEASHLRVRESKLTMILKPFFEDPVRTFVFRISSL